jgi:hypothetical protein
VIARPSDQAPGDSPTRTDIVLTDPLSLTLDDQPRTASPPVPQSQYVVPDVTQLLPGWTASEKTAFSIISPPDNGYRVIYSLVSPTGASYSVDVMAGISMKYGEIAVDINGHEGLLSNNSVWWEQQPGVGVTVSHGPDSASTASAEDVIDVARSVAFATVTQLPLVPIDTDIEPVLSGADFAGTLSGVRYAVTTNSGPLRGIRVIVGKDPVAGLEDDRLSQPTDDPATAGTVDLVGVAGYGAIVFGYTEPATAALRANLANGSTIHVPVLRNPGETYFALPVPLGVEVTTLDFLDITGATLRTATMPSLPADFGHCCAGAPWTTDVKPGPSSSPPAT